MEGSSFERGRELRGVSPRVSHVSPPWGVVAVMKVCDLFGECNIVYEFLFIFYF